MQNTKLRVIVCQHGARRRYAIPRILEREHVLEALYTDSSAYSFLGKIIRLLPIIPNKSIQRLSKRVPFGVPEKKVFSSDCSTLYEIIQKIFQRPVTGVELSNQRHKILSKKMIKWGLRDSNIVYTMLQEGIAFVEYAKAHGVKNVLDVCVSPLSQKIMTEEFSNFSDWGAASYFNNSLWDELNKESLELGDILLCPSEWVAEGVKTILPNLSSRIKIVPYGSSISYNGKTNKPVINRVLFAGGDPLRKGLHYLAKAASLLKSEIPDLDVRVAGALEEKVIKHPICKDLNFLGKLSSEQMKGEYLSADVFILPSLSEGFAGVVAEAVVAGCPVIVTKEAGSPIINGREGLIIPARSVNAISTSIKKMLFDRKFRDSCSNNCINQIPFYSDKEWGKRLLTALEEIELTVKKNDKKNTEH